MNLTGLETAGIVAVSALLTGILGFLAGHLGKVSQPKCKENHEMVEKIINGFKASLSEFKAEMIQSLRDLREEIKQFQQETRDEAKELHDRITDLDRRKANAVLYQDHKKDGK